MDEGKTSSNWVLVSQIDCAEDALPLSTPRLVILTDSDQESDGSISILSDNPTDSYSEEEYEQAKVEDTNNPESVLTMAAEPGQLFVTERRGDLHISEPNSTTGEDPYATDISEGVSLEESDVSSTSGSLLSKQWAHDNDNAKEDLKTSESPFYLDCFQEPILEVSSGDTEDDTESTSSNQECQTVVRSRDVLISNREARRESSVNIFGIGFLLSMTIIILSHFILQHSEYEDISVQSENKKNSFLEGIRDNKEAEAVMDFCMDRQKSKGDYSEHALEKCVIKKLRKRNKDKAIKKTEIYLQIKERMLEIRELELAEKEKELLHKWQKKEPSSKRLDTYKSEETVFTEPKEATEDITVSQSCGNRFQRRSDYKGRKRHGYQKNLNLYEKERRGRDKGITPNSFQKENFWVVNEIKEEVMDRKHKIHSEHNSYNNRRKVKHSGKNMKEELKHIKENIKDTVPKMKLKDIERKQDSNEEWYIKYNPVKNVIQLVDVAIFPDEDFFLIKKGNKSTNGQWYFSLYGTSRNIIRNKETVAEWYFNRGNIRETKRNKAKWYFDYMSARDDTRYFN